MVKVYTTIYTLIFYFFQGNSFSVVMHEVECVLCVNVLPDDFDGSMPFYKKTKTT